MIIKAWEPDNHHPDFQKYSIASALAHALSTLEVGSTISISGFYAQSGRKISIRCVRYHLYSTASRLNIRIKSTYNKTTNQLVIFRKESSPRFT